MIRFFVAKEWGSQTNEQFISAAVCVQGKSLGHSPGVGLRVSENSLNLSYKLKRTRTQYILYFGI